MGKQPAQHVHPAVDPAAPPPPGRRGGPPRQAGRANVPPQTSGSTGTTMQKAVEHKVADSNVENIGSAEDKAARKAAALTEREWDGAGETVGIEIWRVENRRTENDTPDFGVKRWPKEEYGNFFKGDSYILLSTYQKPDDEKMYFDLHL